MSLRQLEDMTGHASSVLSPPRSHSSAMSNLNSPLSFTFPAYLFYARLPSCQATATSPLTFHYFLSYYLPRSSPPLLVSVFVLRPFLSYSPLRLSLSFHPPPPAPVAPSLSSSLLADDTVNTQGHYALDGLPAPHN